jgi:nitrate/TMAO reductase-like tetraheme cytochrome c subunit
MTTKQSSPRRKAFGISAVLIGIVAIGIFLAIGGFSFAASQEEHDPFCASCHTEPETTYVARSTTAPPVDLASFHATEGTRCIDCHSGAGLGGRMQAELLGARNAVAWYTHTAAQPAHQDFPIADDNCLKCHQEVTQRGYVPEQTVTFIDQRRLGDEEAGPNHWHEELARWQATTSNAGTCTSCHLGHSTEGSAASGYQDPATTESVCDACHQVMGD